MLTRIFFAFLATAAAAFTQIDGTFTYANRTMPYRVFLPDGHDTSAPAGVYVYFHGNNQMTQQAVIDMFSWQVREQGFAAGLVPVLVASPETRADGITRQWYDQDTALVHRLVQGGFAGTMRVDMQKVVFSGGSQGTCFLNVFLPVYWSKYGGGFYAGCGCHNEQEFGWQVDDAFRARFKVFVHNSQGDFLLSSGTSGHDYYKWMVGLETRGRFDEPTAHCVTDDAVTDTAVQWLAGKRSLAPDPEVAHWERVAVQTGAVQLLGGRDSTLWLAVNRGDSGLVLRSTNAGRSWAREWGARDSVRVMAVSGLDTMLVATKTALLRVAAGWSSASVTARTAKLYRDNDGTLYRADYSIGWQRSQDGGRTWSGIPLAANLWPLAENANFGDGYQSSAGALMLLSGTLPQMVYSEDGVNFDSLTWPGNNLQSVARLGDTLLAFTIDTAAGDELHLRRSLNGGNAWGEIVLPSQRGWLTDSLYPWGREVYFLPGGDILTTAPWFEPPFRSTDGGSSWTLERGFWNQTSGQLTRTGNGDLYAMPEAGMGILRYFPLGNGATTAIGVGPGYKSGVPLAAPLAGLRVLREGDAWRVHVGVPGQVRARLVSADGRLLQELFRGQAEGSLMLRMPSAANGARWLVVDGPAGQRVLLSLGL